MVNQFWLEIKVSILFVKRKGKNTHFDPGSNHFLEMEPQNGIAFVEVEFVRPAILNIGIQLDRLASMLDRPLLDKAKEDLPNPLRPAIRVDNDI